MRPRREGRSGAGVTGSVTLPDGRVLAYEEYGDPAGFPVLSFHGGMSSRLDAAPAHEAAVAAGVRLVSPDRPGMGLSTYQPGRRLLDWPADVERLVCGPRHRALRRHGLVGRRALRRRLRRQDGRPRDGRRAPLERRAARPLRHDPGAHGGGPRPPAVGAADAMAGLGRHEGEHRQRQQRPAPPSRHAHVPAG